MYLIKLLTKIYSILLRTNELPSPAYNTTEHTSSSTTERGVALQCSDHEQPKGAPWDYNWINQLLNTTIWWLDICCLLHMYQLHVLALMAIFRLIDWQQTCKQLILACVLCMLEEGWGWMWVGDLTMGSAWRPTTYARRKPQYRVRVLSPIQERVWIVKLMWEETKNTCTLLCILQLIRGFIVCPCNMINIFIITNTMHTIWVNKITLFKTT